MEKYYLITCTEDGDHRIKEYTEQKLSKEINEWLADGDEPEFESKLPDNLDMFSGYIIIKGEIIVPKKEKVVEKLSLWKTQAQEYLKPSVPARTAR